MSEVLGFERPNDSPGPCPGFDHSGYKVAILMVLTSLQPGHRSESNTHWDTIQKLKATYSNQSREVGGRQT